VSFFIPDNPSVVLSPRLISLADLLAIFWTILFHLLELVSKIWPSVILYLQKIDKKQKVKDIEHLA